MTDTYKPSWVPEEENDKFACRVMYGVTGGHEGTPGVTVDKKDKVAPAIKRRKLEVDDYVEGVLKCDRAILSRAITLVESNAAAHFETAQQVIQKLLPYTGKSTRVGITGVPGAGKSTFIEALGTNLCRGGHKVAVLAVDPSSTVTKGSILGDKTRMEQLSREPNAFIRPSPSGGTLGGLTRKSRETLLLCEAAGYDTILVETVGVGQSETTVRSMVDFFLLVVLTGAGDELQGMKKGVMELADAIVVNKADGDNKQRAMVTRAEYERILQFLRQATENWTTHAYTCSAYTGAGIMELWNDVIEAFMKQGWGNGYDTILVETVGVGQSETTVRSMVDFFLLVVLTGAGDELQGMKKGVMELADAIVVNKADGDNKQRAMVTRAEYERILQFLRQATENWTTHAYTCSAYTGAGIMELWNDVIEAFMKQGWGNGVLAERRKQQTLSWVYTMVEEHLHNLFYRSPAIIGCKEEIEREVVGGKISATMAVQDLINRFAAAELSGVNVKDSSPFEIK